MDGVEATRRIMANTPCAILIVTGSVRRQRQPGVRGDGARRARRGGYARARFRRRHARALRHLLAKIDRISGAR